MRGDGAGQPAVLLCAGMAEGAATWDRLVPLLAGRHRVLRLDRPGLGVVPAGRGAPTLAGEVARIGAVLDAHAPDRAVLVAHSAAALAAEAYARLRPDRVAGLVLVDPSVVTPSSERLSAAAARLVAAGAPTLRALLDRSGVARRLGPWAWARAVRRFSAERPDPARRAWAERVYGSGAVLTTVLVEWLAYRSAAAELLALRRRTAPPAAPVVVLTALGDLPPGRARATWRSGHAALADAFPAGRQEVLRDARHLVQWDHPGVVAAAVAAVGRG